MQKERDNQLASQEFPDQISNGCFTFSSHELFWKELETIVEDGIELADE